jgi:hypothetical protein
MEPLISVRNISKKYLIKHNREQYETLRDAIVSQARRAGRFITGKGNNDGFRGSEEFYDL